MINRAAREYEGNVSTRGSGNYSSDEAKEIARLQRELRDTKDALEILKKPSVSQGNDRGCLYCHSGVYRRNGTASGEAPCFCQRGTETAWCFTIRLQCMEKRDPSVTENTVGRSNRKSEKSMRIPTRTMEPRRLQWNCGKTAKNRSENCCKLYAPDGKQSPMGKAIYANNYRL